MAKMGWMGLMESDFQLGAWRVQPQLNSIVCDQGTIHLEPKMMGVLVCLAQRSGEVVTKEQLVHEVWRDTFVTDDVLVRCVSALRKVFADKAGSPTVIETIPKRGYRLLLPVVPVARPNRQEILFSAWPQTSPHIYRFAPFEADLETGEVRKDGTKLPLQVQPFQVLAVLLKHSGELVTREQLRSQIWPQETFVDFDHALNTAITKIRQALGDDGERPTYIETLPRRGYRFVAPIERSIGEISEASGRARHLHRTVSPKRLGLGLALLAVVGVTIWLKSRNPSASPSASGEPLPVAVYHGNAGDPALSPDGDRVAFVAGEESNFGIYTALVGGENSIRLTNNPGDRFPTWSPDGRQIAFYRYSDDGTGIYTIPALGGTEHRIYKGPSNTWPESSGLAWSPDGETIAFTENNKDKIHSHIALLSMGDFRTRPLTWPDDRHMDYLPAYSPNGHFIAFQRDNVGGTTGDIYIVPARGGEPKPVTHDLRSKAGLAWTPDGKEIIFSRGNEYERSGSLWRLPVSGGTPTAIAGVGGGAIHPSVARRARRLVYEHVFTKENLWQLDLSDEKHRRGSPTALLSEAGNKMRPHFSPDGRRIAFESDRLGYWEIWACDANGSNCGQLTSLHIIAGAAQWSPDGRYIAFEFHPHEQSEIYLLDVATGQARLLPTNPGFDNLAPSWSRDGQWLYFGSTRGAAPVRFQLWKVPIAGGPTKQVTKNGGLQAFESADGRVLYHTKYDVPGIWKMPVEGGDEALVLGDFNSILFRDWVVCEKGIYLISFTTHPQGTIQFFDVYSRKLTPLWDLEKTAGWGVTLAPDGHSLVYVQNDFNEANIMLVENFH
jgi:Tol biopolymer transport system component/DNA-binding winged helix-turn-helix (wHTH) protein